MQIYQYWTNPNKPTQASDEENEKICMKFELVFTLSRIGFRQLCMYILALEHKLQTHNALLYTI